MRVECTERSARRQHRIETQARTIEAALAREGIQARVRSGDAAGRTTTFVAEAPWDRMESRQTEIECRLEQALKVPGVCVRGEGQWLCVDVEDLPAPQVDLLDMLCESLSWPPGVAVLGRAEFGQPFYVNLFGPHAAHLLLVGRPGSGKSSLLRSLALSLAVAHRQSELQMAFLDRAGGKLSSLEYLPHALAATATAHGPCHDLLRDLLDEMAYRLRRRIDRPRLVVFVDGLTRLLDDGGARQQAHLGKLLRRGTEAGIHLIIAARKVPSREMAHALRAHVPARLVGQVSDGRAALAASGNTRSGAEFLLGVGDFVAVTGNSNRRFQAAYADDYDLHFCLERLQRRRPRPLLARPFDARQRSEAALDQGEGPLHFSFDGQLVSPME